MTKFYFLSVLIKTRTVSLGCNSWNTVIKERRKMCVQRGGDKNFQSTTTTMKFMSVWRVAKKNLKIKLPRDKKMFF